jgi:two-component system sensor histidine kinase KdpD
VALATIAVTIAIATAARPVGLAEVLLIVLVEVIGVSVLAGRGIAAATALGAFLAVNWLLVPPYGTLHIADQANWLTLAVFLALAVGASTLVEAVLAWEREAAASAARAGVLADALHPEAGTALGSLRVLRTALGLDGASLAGRNGEELLGSGTRGPASEATLVIAIPPDLQVRGWGTERLGADPEYLRSVATAVARAWQAEELASEQQRSARLAELDAARATLLASVGHDLRTPLAGIRVTADALAMSQESISPQVRTELLSGLRAAAIRLDVVIGAVLDSSRIESGVAVVEPIPADLADIAARCVAAMDSERVRLDAAEPVPVVVDPILLERIVENLVSNALAHTPEESRVMVTARRSAGGGQVEVADQGGGPLPSAGGGARPQLSPPDAAPDRGRARTGMGLLIVERLATMIGVGISYEATQVGLTVTVTVPEPGLP